MNNARIYITPPNMIQTKWKWAVYIDDKKLYTGKAYNEPEAWRLSKDCFKLEFGQDYEYEN